jgi:hypothetical protein
MPVFQRLVDHDKIFNSLQDEPIIINDLSNTTVEDRELIDHLVLTRYSSDTISVLPRCQCGKLKNEFLIGVVCDHCHTEVQPVNNDLSSLVWLRKIAGTPGLFNPHFWIMLERFLFKSNFNVLRWLTDTTYNPPIKEPRVITQIKEMGTIKRGYNNFFDNFDYIFNKIAWLKDYGTTAVAKEKRLDMIDLIEKNRHFITSNHVSLPNKILLVLENTNKGIYVDFNITELLDAIAMASDSEKTLGVTSRTIENRAAKIMFKLSKFYESYYHKFWNKKTGLFRKHVFGSRTHFSFRSVITSITEPHKYDEIKCPWGIGLTAFRPHVVNKLLKHGYTLSNAIELIYTHVYKYHPLLDQILQELLAEANGRICVLLQRNPSLLQGSAQRVYISEFKTDPRDTTIGMSILIVPAPNADFDGDELNVSIALDKKMEDMWYPLAPHFNVLGVTEVGDITGNVWIPKPVVGTMSNWLTGDNIRVDNNKLQLMKEKLTVVK